MAEIYDGNKPHQILKLCQEGASSEADRERYWGVDQNLIVEGEYRPPSDSEDWYNPDVGFGQKRIGGTSESFVDYDEPNHPSCGLPKDSGISNKVFGR